MYTLNLLVRTFLKVHVTGCITVVRYINVEVHFASDYNHGHPEIQYVSYATHLEIHPDSEALYQPTH